MILIFLISRRRHVGLSVTSPAPGSLETASGGSVFFSLLEVIGSHFTYVANGYILRDKVNSRGGSTFATTYLADSESQIFEHIISLFPLLQCVLPLFSVVSL